MAQTTGSISRNPNTHRVLMKPIINRKIDELSSECLDFIIDHVFLPSQLPQKAEDSIGEKNTSLLRLLYQTSTFYTHYISLTRNVDSTWRATEKNAVTFRHARERYRACLHEGGEGDEQRRLA
jgi:hypothetical protein